MDLNQLFGIFNSQNIIFVVFKILAIFFSIFYLLYAIVLAKQTQVMDKTLQTGNGSIILIVSSFQIIIGVVILFFAIFFL